jgi:hypothetical protein
MSVIRVTAKHWQAKLVRESLAIAIPLIRPLQGLFRLRMLESWQYFSCFLTSKI